jgi:hypothetical protein
MQQQLSQMCHEKYSPRNAISPAMTKSALSLRQAVHIGIPDIKRSEDKPKRTYKKNDEAIAIE